MGAFNLSSMYRIKEIIQAFKKRICLFRPYEYSGYLADQVSPSLLRKDMPISLCNLHPLLTMDNINAVAPDFESGGYKYDNYSAVKEYFYGDVVSYKFDDEAGIEQELILKALSDKPGVIFTGGDFSGDYNYDFSGNGTHRIASGWTKTTPFSEWIDAKIDGSIRRMVHNFISTKLVKGETRLMCEHKCLFEGAGRFVDREKNKNNLVGFEINSTRSRGVTTKIEKIGLQFTKKGLYKLYLMHSSCIDPIRTITLEKKSDSSFEWFEVENLYLPYSSDNISPGGSWYLCYDQSELPEGSEAIIKNKDWSKEPCNSCSRSEYISWKAWSKYLEIHPLSVNKENISKNAGGEPQMWDPFYNLYNYASNYGINLEVSVDCDITEVLVQNASAFDEVLGLQIVVDWLSEFMYNANARTNRNIMNASKTDIILALEGDKSQVSTQNLMTRLERAYKSVNVAFDNMDRVCMACTNNGIKYRAI